MKLKTRQIVGLALTEYLTGFYPAAGTPPGAEDEIGRSALFRTKDQLRIGADARNKGLPLQTFHSIFDPETGSA